MRVQEIKEGEEGMTLTRRRRARRNSAWRSGGGGAEWSECGRIGGDGGTKWEGVGRKARDERKETEEG